MWINIFDDADLLKGYYHFSDVTGDSSETLQQYQITGVIAPTAGSNLDSNDTATVSAQPNSGFEDWFDTASVNQATTTASTGVFTITLFGSNAGLDYTLKASDVLGFPDATNKNITVQQADLADKNISIAVGGVITGRIQNEAKTNLEGIEVFIYEANSAKAVNNDTTDANGTFSIQVPYGTYDLIANGAITEDITVSSSSPTFSKNLTLYQITGRVIDSNEAKNKNSKKNYFALGFMSESD